MNICIDAGRVPEDFPSGFLHEGYGTAPDTFCNTLPAKPDELKGRTSFSCSHIHKQGSDLELRELFYRRPLMGIGSRRQFPVSA